MAWFSRKPDPPAAKAAGAKSAAAVVADAQSAAATLVSDGILTLAQSEECLGGLPPGPRGLAAFAATLEERGYLSPYQAGRVKRGDVEGLVIGGYKLLYRNAAGSFARVFRAEGPHGETVALKVLRGRHADDPKQVAGFRREAELCRRLKHPNIVPIYDVGQDGEYHYFTMEFVEGGNLRDFLQIRKKLSPPEAVRITAEVAAGLACAFEQGITHRDLKSTNVLFDTRGTAKLVDFGLAGEGEDGADLRAVEYATLEKNCGAPRDDPRSDLFFLGAILYELVSGVSPWPSTSDKEARLQVARYRDVKPLRAVAPDVPTPVLEVVSKLMAWQPRDRVQTAERAVAELRRVAAELEHPERTPAAGAEAGGAEAGGAEAGGSSDEIPVAADRPLPTVMCVERRPKHQDVLREYLSKRGFRVLVLGDVTRALARVKSNPPDAVLLMGDSAGEEVFAAFAKLAAVAAEEALAVVCLLSGEQSGRKGELKPSGTCRVLVQPATLRDVRRELHVALQRVLSESRMIRLQDAVPDRKQDSP